MDKIITVTYPEGLAELADGQGHRETFFGLLHDTGDIDGYPVKYQDGYIIPENQTDAERILEILNTTGDWDNDGTGEETRPVYTIERKN